MKAQVVVERKITRKRGENIYTHRKKEGNKPLINKAFSIFIIIILIKGENLFYLLPAFSPSISKSMKHLSNVTNSIK